MLDTNVDRLMNAVGVGLVAVLMLVGVMKLAPDMISGIAGVSDGYDIVYDLNGGSSSMQKRHLGVKGSHTVPLDEPEKDDYHFNGWLSVNRGVVVKKGMDVLQSKYGIDSQEYKDAEDDDRIAVRAGVPIVAKDLKAHNRGDSGVEYIADFERHFPNTTIRLDNHLVMIADWTIRQHTVEYDVNGGLGDFPQTKVNYNEKYTLYDREPTRVGHTFMGWKDSNTFNTRYPGERIDLSGDTIFEATWARNNYVVVYNLAGGSGDFVNAEVQYMDEYKISNLEPVREGHQFNGWFDEDGNKYLPGDLIIVEGFVELTADWSVNQYGIRYDLKNGSGTFAPETLDFGQTHTVRDGQPTRKGYTFDGWMLNTTGDMYQSKDEVVINKAQEHVLSAVWTINDFTVSYDLNSGSGSFPDESVSYNSKYLLNVVRPTRTGYTFTGWKNSVTGKVIQPGTTITVQEDVVLQAQWKLNQYQIRYDLSGGTGSFASSRVDFGSRYDISSTLPTKDGYTFKGWRHSETGMLYRAGSQFNVYHDAVLTAEWDADQYEVKYDLKGGRGSFGSSSQQYNTEYRLHSSKPTRTGYTFKGWLRSDNGAIIQPNERFYVKENTTLTAQWKADVYIVGYDLNSGSGSFESSHHEYGTNHTVRTGEPTRYGYLFDGWRRSDNGQVVRVGTRFKVTESVRLVAQWVTNDYTVSFNANGGYGGPGSMTKQHGRLTYLPTIIPSRSGYRFDGWTLNSQNTGTIYRSGSTYSRDGNVTLYAKWVKQYAYRFYENSTGWSYVDEGTEIVLEEPRNVNSNYEVLGWKHLTTGHVYSFGSRFTVNGTADFRLEQVPSEHTIIYDYNDGAGGMHTQPMKHNSTLTINQSMVPDRPGYWFAGWVSQETGQRYAPGDEMKVIQSDTLKADWITIDDVVIGYHVRLRQGATFITGASIPAQYFDQILEIKSTGYRGDTELATLFTQGGSFVGQVASDDLIVIFNMGLFSRTPNLELMQTSYLDRLY